MSKIFKKKVDYHVIVFKRNVGTELLRFDDLEELVKTLCFVSQDHNNDIRVANLAPCSFERAKEILKKSGVCKHD